MYEAIGVESKTVYTKGTKSDILRGLHEEYPTYESERKHRQGAIAMMAKVLPEPMIIRRKQNDNTTIRNS